MRGGGGRKGEMGQKKVVEGGKGEKEAGEEDAEGRNGEGAET